MARQKAALKTQVTAPVLERWIKSGDEAFMLGIREESVRPEVMTSGPLATLNLVAAAINDQSNDEYPKWIVVLAKTCQVRRLGKK